jgi:hypothetical protein|tara:strand:- start:153063 stop:153200 length:138 start_codon:yes stop_codon:yes gene_type:complete
MGIGLVSEKSKNKKRASVKERNLPRVINVCIKKKTGKITGLSSFS